MVYLHYFQLSMAGSHVRGITFVGWGMLRPHLFLGLVVYLLSKYGQPVLFIMVSPPKFTPSPFSFFFLQERSLNIIRQTNTHSGYHFILLYIDIFQTRSKACREESGLNYGLENIKRLLLCHLPCLVFVYFT